MVDDRMTESIMSHTTSPYLAPHDHSRKHSLINTLRTLSSDAPNQISDAPHQLSLACHATIRSSLPDHRYTVIAHFLSGTSIARPARISTPICTLMHVDASIARPARIDCSLVPIDCSLVPARTDCSLICTYRLLDLHVDASIALWYIDTVLDLQCRSSKSKFSLVYSARPAVQIE